jgi:hypothetical protein
MGPAGYAIGEAHRLAEFDSVTGKSSVQNRHKKNKRIFNSYITTAVQITSGNMGSE